MKSFTRCISNGVILLFTFVFLIVMLIVAACSSETDTQTTFDFTTTSSAVVLPSTTVIPTGVEGSDLLPEDAPEAKHFLAGGTCFQCHELLLSHTGEVLNLFGCDRCHLQTSTVVPSTTPTIVTEKTPAS
jgi:hypothetical protein